MSYKSKNKQIEFDEVVAKMMKYCAYQERSNKEVYLKTKSYGLNSDEIGHVIEKLEADNFLNEERFCEALIKGKLNIKKWGPYKIKAALIEKGVNERTISKLLAQIPHQIIHENLTYWIEYRRQREIINHENFDKHFRFLLSKGFSHDAVYQSLRTIVQ